MNPSSALVLGLTIVVLPWASAAAEDAEVLFVRRVQPLLQAKCLACHGKDEKKIESAYDMRTREVLFKGGESGESAVIPGQPEKSPLYIAIRRLSTDWEPMPPKESEKLTAEQMEWVKRWIAGGAPWPSEERVREIEKANAK